MNGSRTGIAGWAIALLTAAMLAQPAQAAPLELSLDDSVALALKNNPTMKIAQAQQDKAAWGVKQAQAARGFSVDYSYTQMRSDMPPSWVDITRMPNVPYYNFFTNQLSVTLPLYSGGKLEAAVDLAKKGDHAALLGVDATKQQLKLAATQAYYSVLQARNLRDIAKRSVDDFNAHLKNVQSQFDAGTVAKVDVLQTKVQLANAQDGLIKAQNAYEIAVYNLNTIVGLPLQNDTQPKESLEYRPYSLEFDACIAAALEQRPEMARAKLAVAAAQDQVKIAQGDRLPTVAANASYKWMDMKSPGYDHQKKTLLLLADYNVFDSGLTDAKIQQSEAAKVAAQEQENQVRDAIRLEASSAYLKLKEAEQRIETNKVAVEHAELDFSLAQERYEAGVGTNLDVIDSELALAKARTNYTQSLYDYNTAKAQLDRAMGIAVK